MDRHSKQNHITLLVDLHLVQGVQIFYTTTFKPKVGYNCGYRDALGDPNIPVFQYFQVGDVFVNPLSLLHLGSTFLFGMFSFLQCIFLSFSIRDLRGWGLELLLVAIAIYRLRILLEGRWRVYCREQRQAGGLMAPYPANFSILWSNSATNLI